MTTNEKLLELLREAFELGKESATNLDMNLEFSMNEYVAEFSDRNWESAVEVILNPTTETTSDLFEVFIYEDRIKFNPNNCELRSEEKHMRTDKYLYMREGNAILLDECSSSSKFNGRLYTLRIENGEPVIHHFGFKSSLLSGRKPEVMDTTDQNLLLGGLGEDFQMALNVWNRHNGVKKFTVIR